MLMLATAGGFVLLLTLIQGTRNILALGLVTAAGNQHGIAPWSGWHDRLNRTVRNQLEAMAIFVPFVVSVEISQVSNEYSALGAQIFVAARVVHSLVYIAGIPWVRTAAWAVGVVGIILVATPLVV